VNMEINYKIKCQNREYKTTNNNKEKTNIVGIFYVIKKGDKREQKLNLQEKISYRIVNLLCLFSF
jgi:hypothetical protein